MIGVELKKRLIEEGVEPSNVVSFTTHNDKKKQIITTNITLVDGTKHELHDDFIWYAARKNKTW